MLTNIQATCDSSFFKQPAAKIDLFLSSARGDTESAHMSKKIPFLVKYKKKLTQDELPSEVTDQNHPRFHI